MNKILVGVCAQVYAAQVLFERNPAQSAPNHSPTGRFVHGSKGRVPRTFCGTGLKVSGFPCSSPGKQPQKGAQSPRESPIKISGGLAL